MIQFCPATKRTGLYQYIIHVLHVWLMSCFFQVHTQKNKTKRYTGTQKTLDLPDSCHSSYSSYHDNSERLLWPESSLEFFGELSNSVSLGSKVYEAGIEPVSLNGSISVSDTSAFLLSVQLSRLTSLLDIVIKRLNKLFQLYHTLPFPHQCNQ